MNVFEQMAADREALTPESGFNVVIIDDFNFPPECDVEDNFDNLEEAIARMNELSGSAVVYNSKGEAVASKKGEMSEP